MEEKESKEKERELTEKGEQTDQLTSVLGQKAQKRKLGNERNEIDTVKSS